MLVVTARHHEKRIGNDVHILHAVVGYNIVFAVPRPGKERLDIPQTVPNVPALALGCGAMLVG